MSCERNFGAQEIYALTHAVFELIPGNNFLHFQLFFRFWTKCLVQCWRADSLKTPLQESKVDVGAIPDRDAE